jgi:hypothetical protein
MKKTVHTGPAERPILFQTDMVKAILEGRKTQTRRAIKDQPTGDESINLRDVFLHNPEYFYKICKYGKPGDLLWVRETMIYNKNSESYWPKAEGYFNSDSSYEKTVPSIHMPKSAARRWLMIEDIRVERVQEITEQDAKAEGVIYWIETRLKSQPIRYKVYDNTDPEAFYTSCPKHSFETLWISINGEESWNTNPWVWVIQFRVLSTTGKPSDEQIQQNLSALAALREKREEVVNG